MVEVNLWSGLARLTGGETLVPVEAGTIGEMLDALAARHPELKPVLDAGISVAVDGEIVTGGRLDPIPDGAEVYLMQRLKGG